MTQEKTVLAIFDFDGTLTEGHLWAGIAKHHFLKKVKRTSVVFYVCSHLPFWLASKVRLYSEEKNRARWGEDLSVLFKGLSREEAGKVFTWVTDNYFVPQLRPNMIATLKDHQKKGHRIILLSGVFDDFLKVIGQRVGADYVVGTRLETVDDHYTGQIVKPLCFGQNKAVLMSAFVAQKHLAVDWEHCTAYADSIYDYPVFRLVGKPVAVCPDEKLHKLALREKWRII
jgi:HAD superfamily hydrolase (TIGR01490 family)